MSHTTPFQHNIMRTVFNMMESSQEQLTEISKKGITRDSINEAIKEMIHLEGAFDNGMRLVKLEINELERKKASLPK
ncbi:hypothetical protein GOV11_03325 [Candidatus Woesearchaeota archaeon]|nr:hypothetical protein [Candidatus Woesearchaeota archaeon]